MRGDARRKRLIDAREAGKVGRAYYSFYRGYNARRSGGANPFKPGSEDHETWQAGCEFAQEEETGAADSIRIARKPCWHRHRDQGASSAN